MSTDSFREFVEKVRQDADLQEELRSRFGDSAAGISGNELAEFAAGKGYTFAVEDMQGELSDDQMGAVSGGLFDVFNMFNKATPMPQGGLGSRAYPTKY